MNRFLKSSLGKLVDELQDWHSNLETVQYVLNNTFHSFLKSSPSKLLLGFDQRNHEDALLVECLKKIAETDLNPDKERESCRQLALDTIHKIKNYNKIYYDKRHLKPSVYKKGDYVLIKDVIKPGESKKLKPKYKGPYLVAKVLNKNRYVVTDIPGFNLSTRPILFYLLIDLNLGSNLLKVLIQIRMNLYLFKLERTIYLNKFQKLRQQRKINVIFYLLSGI